MASNAVLKDSAGTTFVEAACVFPIVILAVVTVIYGMIFLFDETAAGAAARKAVIREAGRSAGTYVLYAEDVPDAVVTEGVSGIRQVAEGEKQAGFRTIMPGISGQQQTIRARQYVYNEKTQIRLWDLFTGDSY